MFVPYGYLIVSLRDLCVCVCVCVDKVTVVDRERVRYLISNPGGHSVLLSWHFRRVAREYPLRRQEAAMMACENSAGVVFGVR